MSELLKTWDYTSPSGMPTVLSVEHDGQCMDFVFKNTVVPVNNTEVVNYEDHMITIISGSGSEPELFLVTPAPGWEVISLSPIEAPDWATTIITVCQMLLG